jgi:3-isopropylmalate/(R)-2-methylmalate dehydratase small subunit
MGKAYKVGDNVDTDLIVPARYLNTIDPAELGSHCFEDLDPQFPKEGTEGVIVVAGRNFGCGSSREHAPISLKAAGVQCVIAKSFARIFFRNAVNIGLPVMQCEEAADGVRSGDEVHFDLSSGAIRNVTRGETYGAKPLPRSMQEIYAAGGLMNYVKGRLKEKV